jgi:hypothetical protein
LIHNSRRWRMEPLKSDGTTIRVSRRDGYTVAEV